MNQELFLLLAASCFYLVLVSVMMACKFDMRNVIMLFALTVALYYGFRPILFITGLDTPSPDAQFTRSSTGFVTGTALVWLTAYLIMFGLGAVVLYAISTRGTGFFAGSSPSFNRMFTLTLLLTAISVGITSVLVLRYGGFEKFIGAVKVEKELSGLYILKVPSAVGAIVAAGAFLDHRARRGSRDGSSGTGIFLLSCTFLNAICVFLWGQRSVMVVVLVILLLGPPTRSMTAAIRNKMTVRILLAVVLVVCTSAALRVTRDTLITGEVLSVYSEASVWRKASLATNSTYLDASLLSFRDWPDSFPYRGGEDFVAGAAGPVPRLLWEDKPTSVRPGQWLRQVYEPYTINGWPVGAPTVWYLNFGPFGLLIGGVVGGGVFGWLRRAQMNAADCGLNSAIAVVSAVYIFELGWSSDTPLAIGIWLIPLWLVTKFVIRRDPAEEIDMKRGDMGN